MIKYLFFIGLCLTSLKGYSQRADLLTDSIYTVREGPRKLPGQNLPENSVLKDTARRAPMENDFSMKEMRKNSFYAENFVIFFTINYDRIIPLGKITGIDIQAGLTYYDGIVFITGLSFLAGKKYHFFETGLGLAYDFGAMGGGLYGQVNYRYMGRKGLMLKGGIHIVQNVPVFPFLGIGYSF